MAVEFWRKDLLDQEYWNRPAETMPREQLDELHLKKLKSVLRYAHEHSRFYRQKWDGIGFHPEDVETLEDFK